MIPILTLHTYRHKLPTKAIHHSNILLVNNFVLVFKLVSFRYLQNTCVLGKKEKAKKTGNEKTANSEVM